MFMRLALTVVLLGATACSGTPPPPPLATPTPEATATVAQAPTVTPAPPTATPTPSPPSASTPEAGGSGAPARVLARGPATARTVALTFDAGSDRGFAAQILDTLAAEGVVASFGITGVWAERNPDLVVRIAREGHVIINHSYDHASFTGNSTGRAPLSQAQRFAQLDRADAIIEGLTGRGTKPFFRSPFGDYDASVQRDLGARGYAFNVLWTVDSRGWLGISAAEIVAHCLRSVVPGAIYVFHVGSASQDASALQRIIAGLREAGYSFVTVAEYAR